MTLTLLNQSPLDGAGQTQCVTIRSMGKEGKMPALGCQNRRGGQRKMQGKGPTSLANRARDSSCPQIYKWSQCPRKKLPEPAVAKECSGNCCRHCVLEPLGEAAETEEG